MQQLCHDYHTLLQAQSELSPLPVNRAKSLSSMLVGKTDNNVVISSQV